MKLEHVALNVSDPIAMAKWYCEHIGLSIVRSSEEAPFAHFLTDESRDSMIEIYCNPPDAVPDYASLDPLVVHLAFTSEDPIADKARLEKAGATFALETRTNTGGHLVMIRDPWGLCVQLCKRGSKML
jgi:catechol 2,3-dioxygenase-like lactoylglutathione lyase family enzyme|tara:strand:+ start:9588 stop:9971 length:384 start_codon:yes stop_codon:yes gene_type:complete